MDLSTALLHGITCLLEAETGVCFLLEGAVEEMRK